MSDTPLTDALYDECVRNPGPGNGLVLKAHGQKLERQLTAARADFATIARNPGNNDDTGFTSGHIARAAIVRIDAFQEPPSGGPVGRSTPDGTPSR